MVNKDWLGILVQQEKCTEIYRQIFNKLGVKNIQEINSALDHQTKARLVGEATISTQKKPLIIALGHESMAYIGDKAVDYVYFDAHSDDQEPSAEKKLLCCNFINFMDGNHYIIGMNECLLNKSNKAVKIKHNELEKVTEQPFRDKVFLSYDIDVLDNRYTKAHTWGNPGRMSPQQLKDLSSKILKEKTLVGLNVASYAPWLETTTGYKTVDLIVDILKPRL